MKQAKPIIMGLIAMLICCSYSIGQPSSWIGGAAPLGTIVSGASVYPVGIVNSGSNVYPAGIVNSGAKVSLPLREFQCNLISSCGIFPKGNNVTDDAIVNLGGVSSGAIVSLGGVDRMKP